LLTNKKAKNALNTPDSPEGSREAKPKAQRAKQPGTAARTETTPEQQETPVAGDETAAGKGHRAELKTTKEPHRQRRRDQTQQHATQREPPQQRREAQ